MFERHWTMCSEVVNHSRLNSQHNWGEPIRATNEFKNIHVDDDKNIHMSSINYEEDDYERDFKFAIISH